ncbi:MAG: SRPBCC family protein [Burkholderiales bacterium]|nr:SRPBCC family protein [Burkholderiales bacterium]
MSTHRPSKHSTQHSGMPGRPWLAAAGIGAALMYLFDPGAGRRRRALLRDQWLHARRLLRAAGRVTAHDLAGRSAGVIAHASRWMRHDTPSDAALADRIRSRLGRIVSHPHSIRVSVHDGAVTVSGPVLAAEARSLLASIRGQAGVKSLDSRLEIHAEAGNVSGLQGGVTRVGRRFELLQENWSPTARLLTGTAGLALVAAASRRHGPAGLVLGLLGGALLLRAGSNRGLQSLFGFGGEEQEIEVHKSVRIQAPLRRVFDFWTNIRNFPSFMSRVRDVRELDDSRSYWRVAGPAGMAVEWTAEVTKVVPDQLIEWHCDDGAAVKHWGRVRFEPDAAGGTRIQVELHYSPPGGMVGHWVAGLFGVDPKSALDADLMRMKALLETGNPPHDAARPLPGPDRGAAGTASSGHNPQAGPDS